MSARLLLILEDCCCNMQDSSGQERTKVETKVRIINTDCSLLLEVPPFVIFFWSFFMNVFFWYHTVDYPRWWGLKTKLLIRSCISQISKQPLYVSFLNPDLILFWLLPLPSVGPSILLTWASLPPFVPPFSGKEHRNDLTLFFIRVPNYRSQSSLPCQHFAKHYARGSNPKINVALCRHNSSGKTRRIGRGCLERLRSTNNFIPALSGDCSDCDLLRVFIKHKDKQLVLISVRYCLKKACHNLFFHACFYENAMLAGWMMTIKRGIKFCLLASLLTALCVKPHQLSHACLIPAFL